MSLRVIHEHLAQRKREHGHWFVGIKSQTTPHSKDQRVVLQLQKTQVTVEALGSKYVDMKLHMKTDAFVLSLKQNISSPKT